MRAIPGLFRDFPIASGKHRVYDADMKKVRFVHWQDDDMWLGYLEDYPDYMTQGATLQELKENLKEIYNELTGGYIPSARKVDELQVA